MVVDVDRFEKAADALLESSGLIRLRDAELWRSVFRKSIAEALRETAREAFKAATVTEYSHELSSFVYKFKTVEEWANQTDEKGDDHATD